MKWRLCVFGILAVIVHSEAFLFDPPIPTRTTHLPPTTVHSTAFDADKAVRCSQTMLKCMEPFKDLFNYSDPQSISHLDSEAVVNFTCSAEGEKMYACVSNISDCDYTTGGLPSIEYTRDMCKNHRPALHGSTTCQSKFLASDAWMSCNEDAVMSNETHPDGTQCVVIRGIYDCYYKYVHMVCPEYWSFFENQISNAHHGPCHITFGQGHTATKCDDKMGQTCLTRRPVTDDTDILVEFYCSEEGKQAYDCTKRYEAMCSPLDELSIPVHHDFLCGANKPEYKELLECYSGLTNNSDYQSCLPVQFGNTPLDKKSCSYKQQVAYCVNFAFILSDNCFMSSGFYHQLLNYTDSLHLSDCMLSHGLTMPPSFSTTHLDGCNNATGACTKYANDTRGLVEHMCRSGGKPFSDCILQQCGSNGSFAYPNEDQLTVVCQDLDGYAKFAQCFADILNKKNSGFKTCVNVSDDADPPPAEKCSIVQRTYACSSSAIAIACPDVLQFYNSKVFQYYNLSYFGKMCHLRPNSGFPAIHSIVGRSAGSESGPSSTHSNIGDMHEVVRSLIPPVLPQLLRGDDIYEDW